MTCVDRYSRWVEAIPIVNQAADTIADAFLQTWIARFGVPEVITTDRGTNFESNLFREFSRLLGSYKNRTTSYNPKCNGMVERVHRQLKAAIMTYRSTDWVGKFPLALLGMRTSLKPDIGASPSELVYGAPLRLPGQFFRDFSVTQQSPYDFLQKLHEFMRALRPVPASRHRSETIFIHPELRETSHVFVRVDSVRKPLQQPYTGPYEVVKRTEKFFTLLINGHEKTVSLDRLKPAFFCTDNEPDVTTTEKLHNIPVSTRSGRVSKPVVRFQLGTTSSLRGECVAASNIAT